MRGSSRHRSPGRGSRRIPTALRFKSRPEPGSQAFGGSSEMRRSSRRRSPGRGSRRIPTAFRFKTAKNPPNPKTRPSPHQPLHPQPPPENAKKPRNPRPPAGPSPAAATRRRTRAGTAGPRHPAPQRDRNSADDDRRPLRSPRRCLCFQPPHYPKFRSDRQGVCFAFSQNSLIEPPAPRRRTSSSKNRTLRFGSAGAAGRRIQALLCAGRPNRSLPPLPPEIRRAPLDRSLRTRSAEPAAPPLPHRAAAGRPPAQLRRRLDGKPPPPRGHGGGRDRPPAVERLPLSTEQMMGRTTPRSSRLRACLLQTLPQQSPPPRGQDPGSPPGEEQSNQSNPRRRECLSSEPPEPP